MNFNDLKRVLVGEPIPTSQAQEECLDKPTALAVLSSDALSSVAYATQEILLILVTVGTAARWLSLPIAVAIAALLFIVIISYRQTILAYPKGGGAYIVAKDNLGEYPALVAGAALLTDYVLTVSVSVAAGVEALSSAFPQLLVYEVPIGVLIIALVTWANLRGIKESGRLFSVPTFIFIASILLLLIVGFAKAAFVGVPPGEAFIHPTTGTETLSAFLILRAFASGCTALTGIEAISDGVMIFRSPEARNARTTLTWMGVILGTLFLGITGLAFLYGAAPAEETIVSQVARQVFGDSIFYYIVQFATVFILILAANTAFSDFPRLSYFLARDGYLPRQFANLGDRLVFSNGILLLGLLSSLLLAAFGGSVNALIPLYAVGVFTSFTLSQSGMVKRWWTRRGEGWERSLAVNALGAFTTGLVLVVVGVTKFLSGAWAVIALIPALVWVFSKIKAHYESVTRQLSLQAINYQPRKLKQKVVLPVGGIHRGILQAIDYARSITDDVTAVYVDIDTLSTEAFCKRWQEWTDVPLKIIPSPTRSIVEPLLQYLRESSDDPDEVTTVVVPTFVTAKWWQNLLHNQTAFLIRSALLLRRRKVVVTVRFYLDE
ncbi:MAG: APC family permease [Gemmatimonadaceae bacterium]|nr:APC family permease [Gloeobacterales cyanobacterium ES-bin-141]